MNAFERSPRVFSKNSEYLKELSLRVKDSHALFLARDDYSQKSEALQVFKGYTKEYLSWAPHHCKFQFAQTADVLAESVSAIADFDPQDANVAFENLAKYVQNLIDEPWRKDFYRIELISGYFHHNIRAYLENAKRILEIAGYAEADEDVNLLILTRPPDPIVLSALSRDCYAAGQECLILSQIWERVQKELPNYPLTVYEAFKIRKSEVGDVETIAEYLIRETHERKNQFIRGRYKLKDLLSPEQEKYWNLEPLKDVPVDTLVDVDSEETNPDSAEENIINELASRVIHHTLEEQHGLLLHPNLVNDKGNSMEFVLDHLNDASTFLDGTQEDSHWKEQRSPTSIKSETFAADGMNFSATLAKTGDLPTFTEILSPTPYVKAMDVRSRIVKPLVNIEDFLQDKSVVDSKPTTNSVECQIPRHSTKQASSSFKGIKPRQDLPKPKSNPYEAVQLNLGQKLEEKLNVTSNSTTSITEDLSNQMDRPAEKILKTLTAIEALTKTKISIGELGSESESDDSFVGGSMVLDSLEISTLCGVSTCNKKPDLGDCETKQNFRSSTENVKADMWKDIGLPMSSKAETHRVSPWNCSHCTFHNEIAEKVCEVCSKTKNLLVEFDDQTSEEQTSDWTVVGSLKSKKMLSAKTDIPKQVPKPVSSSPQQYHHPTTLTYESEKSNGKTKGSRQKSRIEGYANDIVGIGEKNFVVCLNCTVKNPISRKICECCDQRL